MRLPLLVVLFLLVAVSCLHADTCIRHAQHTDGYYYGGRNNPPVDREYTVWIGDTKVVVVQEYRTVIFDMVDSTIVFINSADSTYIEASLPFELSTLMAEADASRLLMFQTVGEVGEIDSTSTFAAWACGGYGVHTWIPYEGTKYNEEEGIVWTTVEVPFDLDLYSSVNAHILRMRNYTEELIEQYMTMQGYPIYTSTDRYIKGFGVKSTDEVVTITQEEPPAGIYSVPDGFEKKDQLTLRDLEGGG
jgi:hypothetical protein